MAESAPVLIEAPSFQLERPSPFLKWAGGKKALIEQYTPYFPEEYDRYFEPFVGGGAVFFNLRPWDAVLSDVNPRLIDCYTAIRDEPAALMELLERHRSSHCKEYYYACRERMNKPRGLSGLQRAALMIYLNKTCFNGLYRENRKGEFNVPIGSYKNPSVYTVENLISVSLQLQGVELKTAGFKHVLDSAEPGDLVYFDPPYVPISDTASFTSYAKGGFDVELQQELAKTFAELAHRGCYVMLSNSDCPLVRELYRGWRIVEIDAPRRISARKGGRANVTEVLVMGW